MIHDLKYLECCLDEALRLYPTLSTLFRKCVKDYKIPNSDLVIKKGTQVHVPIMGMQRDPEIYEDPLQFKPERFLNSSNGSGKGKGVFYAPFGDGPREFNKIT
jgi:cytochrome P450 family 6